MNTASSLLVPSRDSPDTFSVRTSVHPASLNLASLRGGGLGGLGGLIGSVSMWLATGADQGGQQQVEGGRWPSEE
jgi:hypothetical protein